MPYQTHPEMLVAVKPLLDIHIPVEEAETTECVYYSVCTDLARLLFYT